MCAGFLQFWENWNTFYMYGSYHCGIINLLELKAFLAPREHTNDKQKFGV